MNYTFTREGNQVKITFKLDTTEWEEALEKSYHQNKHKYSIPGFRKGKAPMKALEKVYGTGIFFDDAFNDAFYNAYSEFLEKEKDIEPVDRPGVSIDEIKDGIAFTASVVVRPQVKLGDYKGLTIEVTKPVVTKEEVEHELEHARERAGRKLEVTDRPVENGDIANIDFSGSIDGVKFDGGTAKGYELVIGSGSFIPGFEEQIVGMNIGETKNINVTFPKDYHVENMAGKDAVFEIKVNSISKKELPELNDEFAKDVSEFSTLDEFKADIENTILKSKTMASEREAENKLLEAVAQNIEADIPPVMIDNQVERIIDDFTMRLKYQGVELDKYLDYIGMTLDDFKKSRREEAEKTVRVRLAVEEIIKAENLTPTQEEIDKKIEERAMAAGKSVEAYTKSHTQRTMDYLINELTMDKVIDFLKANNNIVQKELTEQNNSDTLKAEKKTTAQKKTTTNKNSSTKKEQ